MLPGLEPFTTLSLVLTLAGFAGGAVLWWWIASSSGVWQRMAYQANDVWRLLVRQMSIAVGVTALAILLGNLLGATAGMPFRWISIIGGVIFWGFLGALLVTGLRATLFKG